ncbi:LysE family translocator [Zavarzinia compransoris]|uniref:Lysine transporter LysE n=1 Tax=Zavarzinia compransoris TaxID=1264899 RepID=A0A317E5A2_9PROT|nr:LysE family transporter [Zavarzinia compransoris]PWR22308.1 lysine transporter LysE [Zavarzinia compransoris]TDP46928.1 threonine/homoserine/homoserine lactone efflux protein [Zavarzinia compransoris]
MDIELFVRALIVGYVVAAPVGPVNLVCIHRTLHIGRISGFMAGVGGAVADGLFAVVAAFGLTAVSQWVVDHEGWMYLVGGLFMAILGVKTFFTTPKDRDLKADEGSVPQAMVGTFLLTITNPVTILGFATAFAAAGLTGDGTLGQATFNVVGVFAGSVLWWLTLAFLVGLLRGKLEARGLRLINQISGAAIAACGLWALINVLEHPPLI